MTAALPDVPPGNPVVSASGGTAEIFDRGYRRYEGERTGTAGAMRAVIVASLQRALGLRRAFRFKVVPILAAVIAYLPAIAFLGFALLIPNEALTEVEDAATYADYFGVIGISLTLFTAFVAPELMSTDRQTGMLGMYLSGPLSRINYLVAKAIALMCVLLIVTMFPVLFLLLGYLSLGLGPGGIVDTLEIVGKIVLSGVLMSMYFTLIGMAVSSLTSRKGFASAGIVVLLLASVALSETLVEAADAPSWVSLFGLLRLPSDIPTRIFDEPLDQIPDVGSLGAFGMFFGVCALSAAIVHFGYRRLEVTK